MKKIFIIIISFCFVISTFAQDVCGTVTNAQGCSSNGKIDLTINGGFAPLDFVWSNGATTEDISNLAPGTYRVTVSDALCGQVVLTFTVVKDVTQNPIKVVYMKNQLICGGKVPGVPNGKIEIDLPDPSNYTYCWKRYPTDPVCTFTTQNIQGLAPDTYYLTVTDKATGCTMSKQINICCCYDNDYNPKVPGSKPHPNACKLNNSEGEALAVGANPTPPTSSSGGGSISLDISSNNPYTIKWSSNSSPIPFGAGQELGNLAPGRYCYTVTDGCAQFNDCIDLYVCDDTPIKITGTLIKPCEHSSFSTKGGISVNASDGKAPYKYVWAGGSTSPNIASLTQGTYTVKVTDKSGCTKSATFTLGLGTVTSDKITNKDCKEVFNCDGKYAHTKLLNKIWIVDPSPSACKKDEYCENNPDPIGTILGKKNYYRTNIDCRIVSEYCDLQDGSPERLIRTYTDHSNKFELDFKLCKVFETCNGISTPINSPGTSRVFHADGVKITKEWVECTEPVDCKNPKGTCGTAEFCKLKNPATKEEKEEIMPNTFKSNNAIPTGVGAKANTNCSTGKSIDIACDFTGSPVRTVCATGCLEGASEEKVIKFETIPLSSLFVKDYIRMMIEMGEANSNTDIFLPEGVDACTDLQTFNNTINSIIDTNNGVTNGYKKKAADILNSDCNSIARKTNQEDTFLVFPNPTEENVTIQCNSPAIKNYEILIFDNLGRIIHTKKVINATPSQANEVNLSNLSEGIYHVQIKDTQNNIIFSKSVVKQ